MIAGLLLFALAGCFLGILTGLVPGLHVNTLSLLVLSIGATNSLGAVLLIVSMSIVHTLVDFIPSILLGAPDAGSFLSVLPGHRLLLQGKGFPAVQLTIVGGLFAGIAAIVIGPLFIVFIQKSTEFLPAIIPFALTGILLLMLLDEKKKRAWGAMVIVLSSLLGLLALRSGLPLQNPLFCLATGFFGASTLLYSIGKKQSLPEQKTGGFSIEKGRLGKGSFLALLGGTIVSLLPGIGASQAAFIIRKLVGKIKTADYLILLGGVNTANMLLSFFVLFAWGKTRTGSASAIKQLVLIGEEQLLFIVAACLIALGFAAIATDLIARIVLKRIHLVEYKKINSIVLVFIGATVLFFSGFIGILFFATSASIGLVALSTNTRRTNSMAFLMVPTILFYLGI